MQVWSGRASGLLFGLAAAGVACNAVQAAEERLNPGEYFLNAV